MLDRYLADTVKFIRSVGIEVTMGEVPPGSFLPNILIQNGSLVVGERCAAMDVLHEAGHLAITPTCYRKRLSGDLDNDEIYAGIWEDVSHLHPDHPLVRALLQMSDTEATAWAWAAGNAAGLPPETIIMDHGYDGSGRHVRTMLSLRQYMGINGLRAAGMCSTQGPDSYPKMLKWLQDADQTSPFKPPY